MKEFSLKIVEEPLSALLQHARTPISFRVESVFDVRDRRDGGYDLVECAVREPYIKDCDALEDPTLWRERFNLGSWGLLGAYLEDARVGGAVIAFNTPGVDMLEGRSDLAVLWDLRVYPEARRQGIGHALFDSVETWTRAHGGVELKIETQNTNVAACRFYAAQGCELRVVNQGAYSVAPEIQLLWYKSLL